MFKVLGWRTRDEALESIFHFMKSVSLPFKLSDSD